MATGKIISQMITEGVMDMIHGGGHSAALEKLKADIETQKTKSVLG